MSSRALKKLTNKKDELKELDRINKLAIGSDEQESEDEIVVPYVPNKFSLLDEASCGDDSKNESSSNDENQVKVIEAKKGKKKKQKQKKKEAAANAYNFISTQIDEKDDDELISETISENSLLNESNSKNLFLATKKLFQIESKFLNADNEMIRMFGAKIVQGEKLNARNKHNQRGASKLQFKQNAIVVKKPTWPEFRRHGLSMKLVKNEDTSGNDSEFIEFAFEHDKYYQQTQFMFLDAIESMDHNNIINVLHVSPYHIDSLIQMSDISRMSDDTQMAADLIERALYAIQNSFHPTFNIAFKSPAASSTASAQIQNSVIKLDYNRPENRSLFIALFKHLLYVGGKACYRTSLELCKLLLSLDIEGDPLGVILLIDYFALRSSEYKYLIDFYGIFNPFKHLDHLPNMIFSVALAHFSVYGQTQEQSDLDKAEKLLQEGLMRFPSILLEILDKCGVMPDKQVDSQNKIFTRSSNLNIPEGLKYLTDLYVVRMHTEWKIPENLQWLEKNVKVLINKEKSIESYVNGNRKKFRSLFAKVPTNLYRHLILADVKEVAAHLPPEFSSTATYTFDPIPPKNPIISYTRPLKKQNNTSQATTMQANRLLTFFQSMLPSYNNQNEEEQAAAGANLNNDLIADNEGNQFNMRQMAGRLRDFLETMNHQFPEADPVNQDDDIEHDDLEEFD